jgi:hypothetical protein
VASDKPDQLACVYPPVERSRPPTGSYDVPPEDEEQMPFVLRALGYLTQYAIGLPVGLALGFAAVMLVAWGGRLLGLRESLHVMVVAVTALVGMPVGAVLCITSIRRLQERRYRRGLSGALPGGAVTAGAVRGAQSSSPAAAPGLALPRPRDRR